MDTTAPSAGLATDVRAWSGGRSGVAWLSRRVNYRVPARGAPVHPDRARVFPMPVQVSDIRLLRRIQKRIVLRRDLRRNHSVGIGAMPVQVSAVSLGGGL